jgi:branched-chain amino acid transport system ATP-binding protein
VTGGPGGPDGALELVRVAAGYGPAAILHDVSLTVGPGEVVALLGPSGAGKTTLLRAVVGLVPVHAGSVRLGTARLDGLPPHRIAALGVAALPEGRRLFDELSVRENLAIGAYLPAARARAPGALARVERLFPVLAERRQARADALSGGEQQMLAVGRALMASARCLLLDDPLLGLAAPVRRRVAQALRALADAEGVAVLVAGQHVRTLAAIARRAYVLDAGRVVAEGAGPALLARPEVRALLGGGAREDRP